MGLTVRRELARLRARLRRDRLDDELPEEIAEHIALRRDQLIEAGIDPREPPCSST